MKTVFILMCLVAVLLTASVTASEYPAPITVGTGDNSAGLFIQWKDLYMVLFDVRFDTPTITGLGMFDIVEAETSLTTVRDDFGWGAFIDGISFNGHSNIGYDGGENWWHFWIKNAGQPDWTSPMYGVADRVLSNGDMDGWGYGRNSIPEPASLSLLALGLSALINRRRHHPR